MTKSAGILRATGAGALSLSLVAVGLVASTGSTASAAEAGVGEPQQVLIESLHATGKTAVIGEGDWPLSSRTIAGDPAGVVSQAVSMYPVDGDDDAFVLANAEGDVLSRIAGSRDLELLDVAPDDAAANPLATWTVVEQGDRAMILNGEQLNGRDAALNLYDWSTAEGARIATWDRGSFGNNESWRIHELQGTADAVGELVSPGAAPELPATVAARYSWGPTTQLTDIDWELPAEDVWLADGVVEFSGTAAGLFGDTIRIDARYTVGTVGDALDSSLTSYAGVMLDTLRQNAPRTVERTVSGSDVTVTADVRWDWDAVDPALLGQEGEFTVPAVADLGFAATLHVTLVTPREVNVLREGGARAWRKGGSTTFAGLTDGNRDAEGFGDWQAGGAANRINPNWVAYYFDRPRQVTGAALYEPTTADNIGTVTFQVRNMRGGWEDVSVGALRNEGGRLQMTAEFDPVMATGFRAVFEHKSDASWMQLSEFEVWGPGL